MATPEEIRRRVENTDTARSARRAAAAQRVGDLAARRTVIVEQLRDVERELGDVLTEAQDVIGVEELAKFTDLNVEDLTGWLAARKSTRSKRGKATRASGGRGGARRTSEPGTPAAENTGDPSGQAPVTAVQEGPERLVARVS
ncbi:hypothetical protein UO65_0146 [Actinokineospora spheciospongiae]|uniref:Uncharacterized protein n=1 Tax=Actinokineospora spheciospongiae TaxID=909613 RepID=W7JEW5_9PSEU|nr:hypothetical protein [Actinokineospora spheciospongiae]EWC64539.1 hypothetical protein UO65_0146 [Actinokineospora spheciospongiae]